MATTTKEVTLSHGKTRYLESGSGEPVILIHGAGITGGADDWRPALDLFGNQFRFLAPDYFGWPPSDPPLPLTQAFPGMTDYLREFQDALGLKSSHVIGATMGGWIGGLFAYESPSRVDKVILTGNPGFHGAANARLGQGGVPEEENVKKHLDNMMASSPESERAALAKEKVSRASEPGYMDAFNGMMLTMAAIENRARFNLTRRLPHFESPTFFLLGRHDPTSEKAEELVKLTPNSRYYIIEEGGHQIHYEQPEEFCENTLDFLR